MINYLPENWNGILIVGERPSSGDFSAKKPFRGSTGVELQKMMAQCGVELFQCAQAYSYSKTVKGMGVEQLFLNKTESKKQPSVDVNGVFIKAEYMGHIAQLQNWVKEIQPKMIITLGKGGLFALTGEPSIDNFRGSMEEWYGIPVMPVHSPERIMRQWKLRNPTIQDLRKAVQYKDSGWPDPNYQFVIEPDFDTAMSYLKALLLRAERGDHLSVDIETRFNKWISCIGFAWSKNEAFCLPLIRGRNAGMYWDDPADEVQLVWMVKKILECENVRVSGQNYHYDAQYLALNWGVKSHIWCDTMISHHVCFGADIEKGLHVVASLYNEFYKYWKEEGKFHDPEPGEGDRKYWEYNCKDCCQTWEAAEALMGGIVQDFGLMDAWHFQDKQWNTTLKTMLRGTLVNQEERTRMATETLRKMNMVGAFIESLVPPSVWTRQKTAFYRSPTQLQKLFYDVLGQQKVMVRVKGVYRPSTNDEAMKKIGDREPLLKPLCQAVLAYRSLLVCYGTFLTPPISSDGRMRTSYKLAGTSTYRFASSGDCFDEGLNLQNLTKGDG